MSEAADDTPSGTAPGLIAPFPYFGGKRQLAPLVWRGLGDPDVYVEPFFGSGAVLLNRPLTEDRWGNTREHLNDRDGFVANFWRSIKADPGQVAEFADNPVHELDLTARHLWLVNQAAGMAAKMEADPDFYDPKVAGWWVWGISNWIGGGWCSGTGPWAQGEDGTLEKRQRPHLTGGQGVNRQRPHLTGGQGVNRKLPYLGGGQGVNRQLPHLGGGQGVNRKFPHLGGGQGEQLAEWFATLAARLAGARCCCGDWSRVLTDGATSGCETVGVFLDPPYRMVDRSAVYNDEVDDDLHGNLTAWCLENGARDGWRIAVAGYDGDFVLPGWREVAWMARRAMGRASGPTRNSENRGRERVWFSPGCVGMLGAPPAEGA